MENNTQAFINALKNPDRSYGEVPFYWWTGEKLNKERITEQLEALAKNGVAGVQINYAHMNKGGENNERFGGHGRTIHCEPEPFSEEWWDFFGHAARECERLGMGIGVGDYTLAWIGNGFFTDSIAATEGMQAKELSCERISLSADDEYPEDTLAVVAYEDDGCKVPIIVYSKGCFHAQINDGTDAFLIRLNTKPLSINPMHPDCGKMLTDIYFHEFERRLPNLKKGTLNYFFQDELLFGCDTDIIWDRNLRAGVTKKYGYDPLGFIPHLFFDLGDLSPKVRLDITDVKTSLMEEGYFKPVYEFHASRGMIYGCDQSSRGYEPTEFTDYFRAVKWFTAPGNDTPGRAADLIKVKVNSSISHLYERPRTWLEGYHSSGWGTTLESITAPTGDNFIFGANLLNLHGLYYTTNAGFFEWAPPDFHFRMPYWDDEKEWLKKYCRLAQLLTTGKHRCDAAILYPTASCTAKTDADAAIEGTFSLAKQLFSKGIDFDFIDTDSLKRAKFENGKIKVAGEEYKVLIIAQNRTVRYPVISAMKSFLDCGGTVIFEGFVPSVSDRAGANDEILLSDIDAITSHSGCRTVSGTAAVISAVNDRITRSFLPAETGEKVYSLCRILGEDKLYFIRYVNNDSVCRFEATGNPYLLDINNGKVLRLTGAISLDGQTIMRLPNTMPEDIVILFSDSIIDCDGELSTTDFGEEPVREYLLNEGWHFRVIPTLDNRWGDFYKPAGGKIGIEARFFDCSEVKADGEIPTEFSHKTLPYCRTEGIRRIVAHGCAERIAEAVALSGGVTDDGISFEGNTYYPETVEVHDRFGIVTTSVHEATFEQGYHGLKGRVYDDNFSFKDDSVFVAVISTEKAITAYLKTAGQEPDCIYVNGTKLNDFASPVSLEAGRNIITAAFTEKGDCGIYRNKVAMRRGGIYFTLCEKPETPTEELTKCDFGNPDYLHYGEGGIYVFRFRTAPAFRSMRVSVFGELLSATNDGKPMSVSKIGEGNFGSTAYEAVTDNVNEEISTVVMWIKADNGYALTGAIPEPVKLECGEGIMTTGDLSLTDSALCCFSGKAVYSRVFTLKEKDDFSRFVLSAENVGATLRVEINGETAAVLTSAPFTAEITKWLKKGNNELKLTVSNTLCNHYSTIPSLYSNYPTDAKSGLAGDVKIIEI